MLQSTIARARSCSDKPLLIIGNQQHRFLLQHQIGPLGLGVEQVLLEPVARNTAASILIACLDVVSKDINGSVLILPSDHYIPDNSLFGSCIKATYECLAKDEVALLAIKPSFAATEFGYLCAELLGAELLDKELPDISHFAEKPSYKTAESYYEAGNYYWNGGIVLSRAQHLIDQFKQHAPQVYKSALASYESCSELYDFKLLGGQLKDCPAISFDYAVLEKVFNLKAIMFSGEWDDLGNWKTLLKRRKQLGLAASFISADKKSFLLGSDDFVVVQDDDLLLVVHQDSIHELSNASSLLIKHGREDLLSRLDVHRPWGSFKVLAQGDNFLVKQLCIEPKAQISLQSHDHRCEHWVVVKGEGVVVLNGQKTVLLEGGSISIMRKEKHCLVNTGNVPLMVIEVQTGALLAEGDIVRYDDKYNRHLENKE